MAVVKMMTTKKGHYPTDTETPPKGARLFVVDQPIDQQHDLLLIDLAVDLEGGWVNDSAAGLDMKKPYAG